MASYPGSVKTFSNRSAGQTIEPSHVNDLQDEVNAIEAGLLNGTAPLNSSNSTVVALSVSGASTFTGAMALRGGLLLGGQTITLSTGDNNNLVIASTTLLAVLTVNSSGSTLNGISAPTDGRSLQIMATANLPINGEALGSSADSRFTLPGSSAASTLVAQAIYTVTYLGGRWRFSR